MGSHSKDSNNTSAPPTADRRPDGPLSIAPDALTEEIDDAWGGDDGGSAEIVSAPPAGAGSRSPQAVSPDSPAAKQALAPAKLPGFSADAPAALVPSVPRSGSDSSLPPSAASRQPLATTLTRSSGPPPQPAADKGSPPLSQRSEPAPASTGSAPESVSPGAPEPSTRIEPGGEAVASAPPVYGASEPPTIPQGAQVDVSSSSEAEGEAAESSSAASAGAAEGGDERAEPKLSAGVGDQSSSGGTGPGSEAQAPDSEADTVTGRPGPGPERGGSKGWLFAAAALVLILGAWLLSREGADEGPTSEASSSVVEDVAPAPQRVDEGDPATTTPQAPAEEAVEPPQGEEEADEAAPAEEAVEPPQGEEETDEAARAEEAVEPPQGEEETDEAAPVDEDTTRQGAEVDDDTPAAATPPEAGSPAAVAAGVVTESGASDQDDAVDATADEAGDAGTQRITLTVHPADANVGRKGIQLTPPYVFDIGEDERVVLEVARAGYTTRRVVLRSTSDSDVWVGLRPIERAPPAPSRDAPAGSVAAP